MMRKHPRGKKGSDLTFWNYLDFCDLPRYILLSGFSALVTYFNVNQHRGRLMSS